MYGKTSQVENRVLGCLGQRVIELSLLSLFGVRVLCWIAESL